MKVIALVDPHSGGHHTAFMRQFTKIQIDHGYHVVVLHQRTEDDLLPWIRENSDPSKLINCNFELSQKKPWGYGRLNATFAVLYHWRQVAELLRSIEKEHDIEVDVVFFAWLDTFLSNYLHPWLLASVFKYKWAGLYFHPRFLRLNTGMQKKTGVSEVDIALTASKCIGLAIHDRGIQDIFHHRLGGKKVVVFPETADDTPAMEGYSLVSEIKQRASGRTVIGMIGLTKQQGLQTFMELAQKAPAERFFFLFAGRFNPRDMNDQECRTWESFIQESRENCFFHLEAIPEGAEYNAVFCALDIPFLVYDNFTSSSNRLTKAAIFKKPVLSTNRFCLGEDVADYRLGLGVEEGNVDLCLQAIDVLQKEWIYEGFDTQTFEEYAKLNSFDALKDSFQELLDFK